MYETTMNYSADVEESFGFFSSFWSDDPQEQQTYERS